jgi:sugar-specific transcriptional regulator TrmB
MQRLLEKGLVYEEMGDRENTYYAVDPHKLLEMVEEKRSKVESLMPELIKQFKASTNDQSVAIYRGVEGIKNYLLLLEREQQPIHIFGATGASLSPKVAHIFKRLVSIFEKKKIPIYALYQTEVETKTPDLIGHFGKTSHNRIITKSFDSEATYVVFGDYICLQSGNYTDIVSEGYYKGDSADGSDLILFIIKSRLIAEMMKRQFNAMWGLSKDFKKK